MQTTLFVLLLVTIICNAVDYCRYPENQYTGRQRCHYRNQRQFRPYHRRDRDRRRDERRDDGRYPPFPRVSQAEQPLHPRFRCSPMAPQARNGPMPAWFKEVYPNLPTDATAPMPPLNELHYEALQYPRIMADPGYLPPSDMPDSVFYILRVRMILLGQYQHPRDMVRLPYKYATHNREECEVHNVEGEPLFFVLENFGADRQMLRVEITPAGHDRFYVDLPYLNAAGNLMRRRTWVVTLYQEQEEGGPNLNYGYWTISYQQFRANLIPFNAFGHQLHNELRLDVAQLVPAQAANDVIVSISWLPALCLKRLAMPRWLIYEVCNSAQWAIHGMWVNGFRDRQRVSDLRLEILQPGVDFDIVPNMRRRWGLVHATSIAGAMSMQWHQHGRHIFQNRLQFFRSTLDIGNFLVNRLTHNIETRVDLRANDLDTIDLNLIIGDLYAEFDVYERPVVKCIRTNFYREITMMYELLFCFDKVGDQFSPKHCDLEHNPRPCAEWIYFPRTYQLYTYVYQSIFWFPSMVQRLATYRRFNEHGQPDAIQQIDWNRVLPIRAQWKFRGLCPVTFMDYALKKYEFQYPRLDFPHAELRALHHWKSPHIVTVGHYGDFRYRHCGKALRFSNVTQVKGPRNYFSLSESFFDQLATIEWPPAGQVPYDDHDAGYEPDDDALQFQMNQPLPVNQVRDRISQLSGTRVNIECFTNQHDAKILLKVIVCYSMEANFFQPMDCPNLKPMYRQHTVHFFPPEMPRQNEWTEEIVDCGNDRLFIPSADVNIDDIPAPPPFVP